MAHKLVDLETTTKQQFGESVEVHRYVCSCGKVSCWHKSYDYVKQVAADHLRRTTHLAADVKLTPYNGREEARR